MPHKVAEYILTNLCHSVILVQYAIEGRANINVFYIHKATKNRSVVYIEVFKDLARPINPLNQQYRIQLYLYRNAGHEFSHLVSV